MVVGEAMCLVGGKQAKRLPCSAELFTVAPPTAAALLLSARHTESFAFRSAYSGCNFVASFNKETI